MKRKSIIAVLLAAATLASTIAGCGSSTANETKTSQKDTEVSEAAEGAEAASGTQDSSSDADMTPLGKYAEPIEITTAKIRFENAHFPEGKSSSDNITIDWLKDKLNINTKILWETDANDYINKLSLGIASGEIPDMIWIPNDSYNILRMLVENDMLEDLTEAYDKCAGDYMKSTQASFEGKNLEPLTFDGKLMALPGASLGYAHDILWVRKDWLDKLGLEVPKTIDDIKNVARQFIEKDPGGNGEGNTVGIAVNATKPVGGYGNYFGLEPIFNMLDAFPRQWMADDSGKIYYGSTSDKMKEGLQIVRDMYEEGLIDKSFMVRTNPGEVSAFVNTNQVGMYFGPWWTAFERQDLAKTHPESDWIAVNAPLDTNGKFKHMEPSPTANFLCVKKGFKNPEAIVKMLNMENDMARGFMEGGTEAMKEYKDLGTNWVAQYPTGDINIEYYDVVPKNGHFMQEYIKDPSFKGDETTTEQDRTGWKYAKEYLDSKDPNSAGWGEYYARCVGSTILDAEESVGVPSAFYYKTESAQDYQADLDKIEDEMYLKIITGEKPVEYFDEFVEQWKVLGGDVLTGEVQEVVDSQK